MLALATGKRIRERTFAKVGVFVICFGLVSFWRKGLADIIKCSLLKKKKRVMIVYLFIYLRIRSSKYFLAVKSPASFLSPKLLF